MEGHIMGTLGTAWRVIGSWGHDMESHMAMGIWAIEWRVIHVMYDMAMGNWGRHGVSYDHGNPGHGSEGHMTRGIQAMAFRVMGP